MKKLLSAAMVVAVLSVALMPGNPCLASDSKDAPDKDVITANTRFGLKLFTDLAGKTRENVFISPSSVAMALTMLCIGSGGSTYNEMANTLALKGLSLESINTANASLKQLLEEADPKVRLSIANSIWLPLAVTINSRFKKMVQEFYQAEVTSLDFDSGAAAVINEWVKKNTEDKISKVIDVLDSSCRLVLVNAIYFKGSWTAEFNEARTKKRMFTRLDDSQKKHPMMSQSGNYRYLGSRDFQAVRLPYGNGTVSMYIFLPGKKTTLEEFISTINYKNWQKWMSRFDYMKGDITLPRFKIEYEVTLNEAMQRLGMKDAFSPVRANFKRIFKFEQPIYIDQIRHKTFVEVNEEGTEAAAVTVVEMAPGSAPGAVEERFSMVVDRPFVCAIRDDTTGTILFMGAIVDPQ